MYEQSPPKRRKTYFVLSLLAIDVAVMAIVGVQVLHLLQTRRVAAVATSDVLSPEDEVHLQTMLMSQTCSEMAFEDDLEIGDVAPPFVLNRLDGDEQVSLAELRAAKPVVLIFGSYT